MPLRLQTARALGAVLLLTVWVGGMLGGVVHQVQHGLGQAHHPVANVLPTAEGCDHTQHDAAFEHPTFVYDADLCVLCSRQMMSVAEAPAQSHERHTFFEYAAAPAEALPDPSFLFTSIRAPPPAA